MFNVPYSLPVVDFQCYRSINSALKGKKNPYWKAGEIILETQMMTILTVAAAASTNQLKNQEIMGEVQKEIANKEESYDGIKK